MRDRAAHRVPASSSYGTKGTLGIYAERLHGDAGRGHAAGEHDPRRARGPPGRRAESGAGAEARSRAPRPSTTGRGSSDEQYPEHAKNFLDCIRSRKTPIADLASAHRVAVACHLANLSLRLGRSLKWDWKTNTVPGDAEANAALVPAVSCAVGQGAEGAGGGVMLRLSTFGGSHVLHPSRVRGRVRGRCDVARSRGPAQPPKSGMGVLLYSYGIRSRAGEEGFADPVAFAAFCRERGAAGVQVPLGTRDDAARPRLRDRCAELGVYLEGIVRAPSDEKDAERFEAEIRTAKACGADVVRTVLSPAAATKCSRRPRTTRGSPRGPRQSLQLAEPVVRKHKVKLAVENHKDYRIDELASLMKRFDSEFVGVCLDTGNNIALLEEPLATAEALAKWTVTVHLKDMGVEESKDGFLLSEVPLGRGLLDLKGIVAAVRKANPKARFNLEMITRDPLSIPCLTDKYWATLERMPGRDLARMMAWVRAGAKKEPLPRITKLSVDEQVKAEDRHVRESFEYAANVKLLEESGRVTVVPGRPRRRR